MSIYANNNYNNHLMAIHPGQPTRASQYQKADDSNMPQTPNAMLSTSPGNSWKHEGTR